MVFPRKRPTPSARQSLIRKGKPHMSTQINIIVTNNGYMYVYFNNVSNKFLNVLFLDTYTPLTGNAQHMLGHKTLSKSVYMAIRSMV